MLHLDQFVLSHTRVRPVAMVPEILLHQAEDSMHLWNETTRLVEGGEIPPPFWAFAWAGGQALARFVLDNPDLVRGRSVLDFACGSGLVGIAAALAGAARVTCVDIDALAIAATQLNADLNHASLHAELRDCVGAHAIDADIVLAGDVFYERALSQRVVPWFRALASLGVDVVVCDPDRAYPPGQGFDARAHMQVPVSEDLEGRTIRSATIWRATTGS